MDQINTKIITIQKRNIILQRQIGSGSYSKVYLATFRSLPVDLRQLGMDHVAVKVAKRKVKSREEVYSEILNMAKVSHPNMVGIIGIVDSGRGIPWLVMEFMRNGTVFDIVTNSTAQLEEKILLHMMSDVALGMCHLHSTLDMVHGDLHSKNCFVDANGTTKVGDFGFTCRAGADVLQHNPYDAISPRVLKAALLKHCTRYNSSPHWPKFYWLPPEYLLADEFDDLVTHKPGDAWAYGTLVFQMWARGHLPFENLKAAQIQAALLSGMDPFEFLKVSIPSPVLTLTLNCWEYEPAKRSTFQNILATLTSNFDCILPTNHT